MPRPSPAATAPSFASRALAACVHPQSARLLAATRRPRPRLEPRRILKPGPRPEPPPRYGSYGEPTDPYFTSRRLSLLDRGWAFAIAHGASEPARGGGPGQGPGAAVAAGKQGAGEKQGARRTRAPHPKHQPVAPRALSPRRLVAIAGRPLPR
jgi:hypothetical protein